MPPAARVRAAIVLPLLAGAVLSLPACVTSPQAEARRAQQMLEMSDAVVQVRQQTADLQTQLDSLKQVLLKQDTTNIRLANVTGIVVAK